MKQMIRNTILTAAAFAAFAAPAFADSACIVTAPEIRLRKSPSKKSKVVAVLKKDTLATSVGKCGGGWVKVTSKDGRLSGYVGGWAIADVTPATVAASASPALPVVVVKTETAVSDAVPKETPTNDALAIQITDLRLKVLGLDRDVDTMKKDIQKIKVAVARNGRHKHPAKKI
jgi:uncharacterized protein YgiM (DUF1202 family)